jgi:hypothetical protein
MICPIRTYNGRSTLNTATLDRVIGESISNQFEFSAIHLKPVIVGMRYRDSEVNEYRELPLSCTRETLQRPTAEG